MYPHDTFVHLCILYLYKFSYKYILVMELVLYHIGSTFST